MCLAVPGKVKKIEGKKIWVEYPGEVREALGGGVPVKIGDYVLIQMGIIIKKLTPKEAKATIKTWERI